MNNKIFFGLLILAAGVLVGWYVLRGNSPSYETSNNNSVKTTVSPTAKAGAGNPDTSVGSNAQGESMEKGGVQERKVVTYTDSGFAPQVLTVKQGVTVTFVNESSRGMWVASAVHPTHQLLPGFDQLSTAAKGATYEYVFVKVGTWKYHNHVSPADNGSVVVTQ